MSFPNFKALDDFIRQNYADQVENALNAQIMFELKASHAYMSLAAYYMRPDVALENVAKWFMKQSDEEREHATGFIEYQNRRGGRVILRDIDASEKQEFTSLVEAFQFALDLEKGNNEGLLRLHEIASQNKDKDFCILLEDKYLEAQTKSIEEIGRYVTKLKRLGKGLGEDFFDKEILESC
uniref:Ferritin n=1 Tax=Parastrongyloides trichosuri TaxID=131310 RepID=A0A0N4ZKG5_PARTI